MNPTSSNPSNEQCSSENITPDLTDLVIKAIKEQFPQSKISMLPRWGKEIRIDKITVGCITPRLTWETWHWETRQTKDFEILERVLDKSVHVSDPSFFDIIKNDCYTAIVRELHE